MLAGPILACPDPICFFNNQLFDYQAAESMRRTDGQAAVCSITNAMVFRFERTIFMFAAGL